MQRLLFVCAIALVASAHSDSSSVPTRRTSRPATRPSATLSPRRGAAAPLLATKAGAMLPTAPEQSSVAAGTARSGRWWWAVLHNYLYFLALGLAIPVLARVISTIVNPDGSSQVSPASSVIGGDVEALDKVFTFLCVGFLGAASDVLGRKALMAYSALGFALTCLLQASCRSKTLSLLYLADLVDGVSSCMNSVCQAYVADASPPERRAVNLGLFQGISVAGAFILGFPLSAVISGKYGLRAPLYASAGVGFLNFALCVLFTPESLPKEQRKPKLDLTKANPLGALQLLFARSPLMRGSATTFALLWLANTCMNSLFGNYVNHKFGWGPQESAPLLVVIGLMFLVAPGLLVPRLGLRRSMEGGMLTYGLGMLAIAFARTPKTLVSSVFLSSIGCIGTVSLVAFISGQAEPNQRGALLGAVETLQELMEAFGHSFYGRLFAYCISDGSALAQPGTPFVLASALLLAALASIRRTLAAFPEAAARFLH